MSLHLANVIEIFIYMFCSFLIAVFLFPPFIELIKKFSLTQKIRENALSGGAAKLFNALHAHKSGTPTMGGVIIIFAVVATVMISRILSLLGVIDYSILNRGETYLPIVTLVLVGGIGLVDDYFNIREKNKQKGISASIKMWSLFLFALVGAFWFAFKLEWSILYIPFFGEIDIGLWYAPLFIFIFIGTSNSVNLTDGLDGLAGGLLIFAYLAFAVISYMFGLPILSVFCAVVVGALIAFLWWNIPPAKIYMGDTGSLALGATLGVIAMLTNSVIVLAIIGGIFVLETVSVLLQLFWKKFFKKKLFLIAPLHHHFEAKKWSESQVVMRAWIFGMGLAVIGVLVNLFFMNEKIFIS